MSSSFEKFVNKEYYGFTAATTIVVILIILSIVWVSYSADFSRRRDQIGLLLSGLGGIALIMTVFDRRANQQRQIQADEYRVVMDDLENQRSNFLTPLKDIVSYYPNSVRIYNEMFGNISTKLDVPKDVDPIKQQMVEQAVALTIFQNAENFMSIAKQTSPSVLIEWLSRLVLWFQSPILQAQFEQRKSYFSDDALLFINNIIQQSNQMKKDFEGKTITVENVRKYATQIEFTPRSSTKSLS
jgi:hypothetical protein